MSLDDVRPDTSPEKAPDGPERGDHLQYLLTAYLFDSISEEGRREVEEHLEGCAECRDELQILRQTLGLLQGALEDGHETYSFDERRRSRILAAAARKRGRIVGFIVAHPVFCSAAVLLIALVPATIFIASMQLRSSRSSDTSMSPVMRESMSDMQFSGGTALSEDLLAMGAESHEGKKRGELAMPETRTWAERPVSDLDGDGWTFQKLKSLEPTASSSPERDGMADAPLAPAPSGGPGGAAADVGRSRDYAFPRYNGSPGGGGGNLVEGGRRSGGAGQLRQQGQQAPMQPPAVTATAAGEPTPDESTALADPAETAHFGQGSSRLAGVDGRLARNAPEPARKPASRPMPSAPKLRLPAPTEEVPPAAAPRSEAEIPAVQAAGGEVARVDLEEDSEPSMFGNRVNDNRSGGRDMGFDEAERPVGGRSARGSAEDPRGPLPLGELEDSVNGAPGADRIEKRAVGGLHAGKESGSGATDKKHNHGLDYFGSLEAGDLDADGVTDLVTGFAADSGLGVVKQPKSDSSLSGYSIVVPEPRALGEKQLEKGKIALNKSMNTEDEGFGVEAVEDDRYEGLADRGLPGRTGTGSRVSATRSLHARVLPGEWGQTLGRAPLAQPRPTPKDLGGESGGLEGAPASAESEGRSVVRESSESDEAAALAGEPLRGGGTAGGKARSDGERRQSDVVEKLFAAYYNYRVQDPNLDFDDFVSNPRAVPPPQVGDEGLGRDAFRERYGTNPFVETSRDRESTFAMEVDTASFTRARSVLAGGQLPPPDSVRVEEFVNYIRQDYPTDPNEVFAVHCDGSPSPFAPSEVELLRIGIKARDLAAGERQNAVLTFAIDVSGSMAMARGAAGTSNVVASENRVVDSRLELVKRSIRVLLAELAPTDQVALVSFASQATLVLPHTPARHSERIEGALDSLFPQGGTNVEAGLDLAYRLADDALSPGAVHRVILVSDGVANIGARDPDEILARVKVFARRGVYLSIYGVGGHERFNDDFLERLTNEGNGKYDYIDTLEEAKRLFVEHLPANLAVLARDAKIQVVFQPEAVSRYRLLGYENRDIKDEDFRNDRVDAGEVGPGSTVTALYEIVRRRAWSGPIGKVYVRYHNTRTQQVEERNYPIPVGVIASDLASAAGSLRLVTCAAELAELLRHSYYARDGSFGDVLAELSTLDVATRSRPEFKDLYAMASRARDLTVSGWSRALGVEVQVDVKNTGR